MYLVDRFAYTNLCELSSIIRKCEFYARMHISDVLENKIKHLINQRVRKYNTVNQNFVAFFCKNRAEGDFQQGEADYSRATEGSLLYYSKSNLILLLLQYI